MILLHRYFKHNFLIPARIVHCSAQVSSRIKLYSRRLHLLSHVTSPWHNDQWLVVTSYCHIDIEQQGWMSLLCCYFVTARYLFFRFCNGFTDMYNTSIYIRGEQTQKPKLLTYREAVLSVSQKNIYTNKFKEIYTLNNITYSINIANL